MTDKDRMKIARNLFEIAQEKCANDERLSQVRWSWELFPVTMCIRENKGYYMLRYPHSNAATVNVTVLDDKFVARLCTYTSYNPVGSRMKAEDEQAAIEAVQRVCNLDDVPVNRSTLQRVSNFLNYLDMAEADALVSEISDSSAYLRVEEGR